MTSHDHDHHMTIAMTKYQNKLNTFHQLILPQITVYVNFLITP